MPSLTGNGPLPRLIPKTEIKAVCEKFNLPLDIWRRQERAFGLLRKIYAKRAALRGQQLTVGFYSPSDFTFPKCPVAIRCCEVAPATINGSR